MLIALALLAQAATAAPTGTDQSQPPAKPKLICRTYEVTGSLVSTKKVCLSREQWAAADEATQDQLNAMDQNGRINSDSPR